MKNPRCERIEEPGGGRTPAAATDTEKVGEGN